MAYALNITRQSRGGVVEDSEGNIVDIEYLDTLRVPVAYEPEYDGLLYVSPLHWAVDCIIREGATDPSASPFAPGTWYTGDYMPVNGQYECNTVHLDGFTEDEQRTVYEYLSRYNRGDIIRVRR